jgi:hypothetical protein
MSLSMAKRLLHSLSTLSIVKGGKGEFEGEPEPGAFSLNFLY